MKKLLQVTFYQLIIMSLLISGLVTGISVVSANSTTGGGSSNPISNPVTPTPTPTHTGSTIKIFAKGTKAQGVYPTMILVFDGKYITHWENIDVAVVGGWKEYTHAVPYKVNASQVGIGFANDLWLPALNEDRNLYVDRIEVDGEVFQTEASDTYDNGVSTSQISCGKGFLRSEVLHCNGYFAFKANTTPTPTPEPVRSEYWVKPYLVYPADKEIYPAYDTAVRAYMNELQDYYRTKVGATFAMKPLVVVRSKFNYDTMRCDPNPYDLVPPILDCLNDPKRIDGNWGYYMNIAINGIEKWEEKTATLVFSAGGGGYAGANKYSHDAGFAIVGDWVLEKISSVVNTWGIPCKYSDGWQCEGGAPGGTPAHELGHAFGLPHPDPVLYPGQSIMKWHGDYPAVGFLEHEIKYLKDSPFFK